MAAASACPHIMIHFTYTSTYNCIISANAIANADETMNSFLKIFPYFEQFKKIHDVKYS
jgi:hypothetical protein